MARPPLLAALLLLALYVLSVAPGPTRDGLSSAEPIELSVSINSHGELSAAHLPRSPVSGAPDPSNDLVIARYFKQYEVLHVSTSHGRFPCIYVQTVVHCIDILMQQPSYSVSLPSPLSRCLPVGLPACLFVCLALLPCVCLSGCRSGCLSICLSVCLPPRPCVCLSACLPACPSMYVSVCMCVPLLPSVCLSVCDYVYCSVSIYPSDCLSRSSCPSVSVSVTLKLQESFGCDRYGYMAVGSSHVGHSLSGSPLGS